MKIDPNNPRSFYLTIEENQKVFESKVLPILRKDFDFSKSTNPTALLTAGLPGAGKSSVVLKLLDELNNNKTFIANSDEMRSFHPLYNKAMEIFGSNAGAAIYKDSSIFSEKSINYALEQKANFIIDGTMKDIKKAEELIDKLQSHNYQIKVTMLAVNEYESLHGVFNRYAAQYKNNPSTARFVDPKYIKEAKYVMQDVADMLYKKGALNKILDREHNILYDSNSDNDRTPSEIIAESIHVMNWELEKLEKLKDNWKKLVERLYYVDAPKEVIDSAKSIMQEVDSLPVGLYLKYLDKNKKHPIEITRATLGDRQEWQNEVMPYEKSDTAKNWDWVNVYKLSPNSVANAYRLGKLFGQEPEFRVIKKDGVPVAMMLQAKSYEANILKENQRLLVKTNFVWFLQKAPREYLQKHGIEDNLDIKIVEAMLDTSNVTAYKNNRDVLLHADKKGGDKLLTIYSNSGFNNIDDSSLDRISLFRENDGRYFHKDIKDVTKDLVSIREKLGYRLDYESIIKLNKSIDKEKVKPKMDLNNSPSL